MTRRSVLFLMMFSSILLFSLACGGSSSTTVAPSGTVTGTGTGTGTPTPTLPGTFTLISPSGTVTVTIGNVANIRWTAAGFAIGLVLRVGLSSTQSAAGISEWFPMTYSNGTNTINWNTTGYAAGDYYIVFKLEVNDVINFRYSDAVTLTTSAPYDVPPTLQLLAPVTSKTVYPNSEIDINFVVGNSDATVVTTIGIDDDQNHNNGVYAWLPVSFNGPGAFAYKWVTTGFPNGTFFVSIRSTRSGLNTYAYTQSIVIADFIDFGNPPVVEFQAPTAALLVTAGTNVSTRFSMTDSDSIATCIFVLDNDTNPDNGWVQTIYDNVQEGVRSFDWATLGVSPGIYYFLVIAQDGVNTTIKYSPAVIVNPAVGLTNPPIVTILSPTRSLIVPVGAPMTITGTVVDNDSEVIVQVGIDNDDNYANGVTGWIYSTFSGAFVANWVTTYYPAGVYRVIVLARDGINEVYKYTDTIELKHLMPSGFNTSKIMKGVTGNIFDSLDSIGAYRALHSGTAANLGIYHTSNGDGSWVTTQAITNYVDPAPLSAGFDALDQLHVNYIYGWGTKYINNRILGSGNATRISYNNYATAVPIAISPSIDGNDKSLTASVNGQEMRIIYAHRVSDVGNMTTIVTSDQGVNGYKNFWGWMHTAEDGKVFVVVRVSDNDSGVITYPVYYVYFNGTAWTTPKLIARQITDGHAVKAMFYNNNVYAMAQMTNNVVFAQATDDVLTTENFLPTGIDDPVYNISWADMNVVNGLFNIAWREDVNLNISTRTAGIWNWQPIGTVKAGSPVKWLSAPDAQYIITSNNTQFGAFRGTLLGWQFEPILVGEGFLPSAAFTNAGDIVVAYRTTAGVERRLNLARRNALTNTWLNTPLGNDCSTFGDIKIFVNGADNLYIRYFDTDNFLAVVTFR